MNFMQAKEGFLGLDDQWTHPELAKAVILPVPYEQTTSYGSGTANGPMALINASHQVELYDEELDTEPYQQWQGVATAEPLQLDNLQDDNAITYIAQQAGELVAKNKLVVGLGGEHTVTAGLIAAQVQKNPSFTVLQIDAHTDLRESYEGNRWSHASVMARVRDLNLSTVAVGIRSQCTEEADKIRSERLPVWYAHDLRIRALQDGWNSWFDEVIAQLGDTVYITIDVDGFDPSIIPATGTPEPGGLLWHEVLGLLRQVCIQRQVIAFDVVELAPTSSSHHSEFTAAKLTYKMLGYIATGKQTFI
jgi:agmatinase